MKTKGLLFVAEGEHKFVSLPDYRQFEIEFLSTDNEDEIDNLIYMFGQSLAYYNPELHDISCMEFAS